MNFGKETAIIMKPFLKLFGQCDEPTPLNKDDQKSYQTILISLYNETIFKEACFQSKLITERRDFKQPEGKNSRYFPAHIQKYIEANEQVQLVFTCGNVGQREISIIFTLFSKIELKNRQFYTQYVKMMYIWLHICGKYAATNCTESLNVFIYPTPFNKKLVHTLNNNVACVGNANKWRIFRRAWAWETSKKYFGILGESKWNLASGVW